MNTMTATRHLHNHTHKGANPLKWLANAITTHRQRLLLEDLDDHMLDDIGIDRATAHREAHRPFWDLPR